MLFKLMHVTGIIIEILKHIVVRSRLRLRFVDKILKGHKEVAIHEHNNSA